MKYIDVGFICILYMLYKRFFFCKELFISRTMSMSIKNISIVKKYFRSLHYNTIVLFYLCTIFYLTARLFVQGDGFFILYLFNISQLLLLFFIHPIFYIDFYMYLYCVIDQICAFIVSQGSVLKTVL